MAMRRHPEVLEMYERLRPLHRATSFGRLYNAGTTEVKETLSRNTVYQLIMQHLQFEGMRMSRAQIEDETKIKCRSNLYGLMILNYYFSEVVSISRDDSVPKFSPLCSLATNVHLDRSMGVFFLVVNLSL